MGGRGLKRVRLGEMWGEGVFWGVKNVISEVETVNLGTEGVNFGLFGGFPWWGVILRG